MRSESNEDNKRPAKRPVARKGAEGALWLRRHRSAPADLPYSPFEQFPNKSRESFG